MKKQRLLVLLLAIVFILSCGVLAACKPEETTLAEYTITFSGASGVATIKVTHGQKATKPADPTRSGYTFGGWYLDANCTQAFDFSTAVIEQSIVLYAKWTEVNQPPVVTYHTVSFNTNGGTPASVPSQQIVEGSTPKLPTVAKNGFVLDGWYTDAAFTAANRFVAGMPITGNITLYAKWKENTGEIVQYTFAFNVNGGSKIDSIKVNAGAAATKPNDPTKEGYTFVGWYADSTFIMPYVFTATVNSDTTIYAKWEAASFLITWDSAYVQGQNAYSVKGYFGTDGNVATSHITARPNEDGVISIVNGDYLIFAIKKGGKEDVTSGKRYAVLVNGTVTSAATGAALTLAQDKIPNADGYTYYCVQITKATTIRIIWTQYVTYDLQGGSISNSAANVYADIVEGKVVKVPANPTRDTYDFKGWFTDTAGTIPFVNENIVLVADTVNNVFVGPTVYAKWEKKQYTVTIANNAPSGVKVEFGKLLEGTLIGEVGTSLTVEDGKQVGLRIRDERLLANRGVPITVRVNGKLVPGSIFMANAPATQGTSSPEFDRTFTFTITAKTDIVVNAEHTQVVAVNFAQGLNDNVLKIGNKLTTDNKSFALASAANGVWVYSGATAITIPFATNYNASYIAAQVDTYRYASKEAVVYYIELEAGYEPVATKDVENGGTYTFSKITAATTNIWQVTYTMPTLTKSTPYMKEGAGSNVDLVLNDDNPFIILSSKTVIGSKTTTYSISGLNTNSSGKWMLIQVYKNAGVWTQLTTGLLASFNVDTFGAAEPKYSVALVSLDGGYYRVAGGGLSQDGTKETEQTIKIGGVEYPMWLVEDLTLAQLVNNKLANVTFTVTEYVQVIVKTNLKAAAPTYIKLGEEYKFTKDTAKYQVMINGAIYEGTGAALEKNFAYQANGPIVVEFLQRYSYNYSLGNYTIKLTDNTINALYGETVHFKAVGEKEDCIITVKVGHTYISGTKAGVYSFVAGADKLEPTDFVETNIAIDFDSEYVTVLNGTDEIYIPTKALNIKDPITGKLIPALGLPVRANYIFRGLRPVKANGTIDTGAAITLLENFNKGKANKAGEPNADVKAGDVYAIIWEAAEANVKLLNKLDTQYFKINEVYAGNTSLFLHGSTWLSILDNILVTVEGNPYLGVGGVRFSFDTILTISLSAQELLSGALYGKKPVLLANGKPVPYENGAFRFRVGDYCSEEFEGSEASEVIPTLKLELFFNYPTINLEWDGKNEPKVTFTGESVVAAQEELTTDNAKHRVYVFTLKEISEEFGEWLFTGLNPDWSYSFFSVNSTDAASVLVPGWDNSTRAVLGTIFNATSVKSSFFVELDNGDDYTIYWLTIVGEDGNAIHLVFIVYDDEANIPDPIPTFNLPVVEAVGFNWGAPGTDPLDLDDAIVPIAADAGTKAAANKANEIFVYTINPGNNAEILMIFDGLYDAGYNYYFGAKYVNDLTTITNGAWALEAASPLNDGSNGLIVMLRPGTPAALKAANGDKDYTYEVYWLTVDDNNGRTIHLVFIVTKAATVTVPAFTAPTQSGASIEWTDHTVPPIIDMPDDALKGVEIEDESATSGMANVFVYQINDGATVSKKLFQESIVIAGLWNANWKYDYAYGFGADFADAVANINKHADPAKAGELDRIPANNLTHIGADLKFDFNVNFDQRDAADEVVVYWLTITDNAATPNVFHIVFTIGRTGDVTVVDVTGIVPVYVAP